MADLGCRGGENAVGVVKRFGWRKVFNLSDLSVEIRVFGYTRPKLRNRPVAV